MSRRLLALILLALAQATGISSPARADDDGIVPLPVDPSLTIGTLENGLHYVVRKHDHPPGRAVVWLHFHTGSMNETDRQRGIAHYLEHMAFNGSTNFKPGTLVPFFESLGMTFGRDQNAFTNMEQTTYQLSLPDTKPDTLGKGMMFLADIVDGLLLLPKEIDAERQIIQEERRRGLGGRQRTRDAVMAKIAPGSLYSQRETIGLEGTIDGVVEKDFRDYYGAWYAASNATLMVVTDAEPKDVVKIVAERFGGLAKKPRPARKPSGVVAYAKSFAIVATDPEIESEDVRITRLEPVRPPITTGAAHRDDVVSRLAKSAFARRLEDQVASRTTSFRSPRVDSGNEPDTLWSWELSGRAAPGKWQAAIEELAVELQRARAFGFTERELSAAKRQMLSDAERDVETEPTLAASWLVRRINNHVTTGNTLLSPTQRLERVTATLSTVTAEEVAKRFAAEFDPTAVAFVAVLPAGPGAPSEAQLLEIGTKALAIKPEKGTETAHATRLMAELPKPCAWKETDEHAATGVWSGWLENGVRVHHRLMDTVQNEVSVAIAVFGGELLETAENRGITSAAQQAWAQPATKTLSSTDVRELMTGKKVSVRGGGAAGGGRGGGRRGGGGGGGVGSPAISLSVSGSPDELETGLQLAHLLLTEPRIEPRVFSQFVSTTKESLGESQKNPMALGMRTAGSVFYPDDDARFRPLTSEQVDRLTLPAAQAWLDRLVRESPIEVTVVGDLSRERALDLVARYVGSLPARDRVGPETSRAARTVKRPAGPRRKDVSLATPTPQAFVLSGFYGADESDVADARALGMAARVLTTRMTKEVREKEQLVYSISASSRAAATLPGFGVFSASAPTEPHKVAALVEKLGSMYAEFAKSGPTDDELAVAKKQAANTIAEQWKDPSWWMGRLDQMTFRGVRLDDVAGDAAAYQAMTAAQVKETFAKYAKPDASIVVTVKPAEAPPGPTTPK